MSEKVRQGIDAIRRLNPHPNRFARYVPGRNQYVQVSQAPTDEEIEAHIRGVALLGAVSSDDEGKTTSVGMDLDAHTSEQKPLLAGRKFVAACQAMNMPVLVHTSKSGKGLHIRTLFKEPTLCWLARALFISIAINCGISGDKAMDKVWPPSQGFGVLALPYQSRFAQHNAGSLALDPETFSVLPKEEQLTCVTESMEMSTEEIEQLLYFLGVKSEQDAKILSGSPLHNSSTAIHGREGAVAKDGTDHGIQHMIRKCMAVRRLESEAATIPYDFWFGMMTNFKPFDGGKEIFQAFSELDVKRWDAKEFEASWRGIIGKPRLCENLQQGWQCPNRHKCDARSPAGLPFALKRQGLAS